MNGKVTLLEYLCFRYGKGIEQTVNSLQGDKTKVDEAAAKLAAVLVNAHLFPSNFIPTGSVGRS